MGRLTLKKEKIIEEILLQNYDSYYRLAYSYVKNEMDAGDIVQNGAYQAIRKADTLREEQYAATWVYRIMLNEIFKVYQTSKKEKRNETADISEMEETIGQEDVYENLDLQRALNGLSKEDKAVVEMKYFEELKLSEIAQILGENISTVKSRLYRSLKKLRLELEAES